MMLMLGNPPQFCDGVTRREALTIGASSVIQIFENLLLTAKCIHRTRKVSVSARDSSSLLMTLSDCLGPKFPVCLPGRATLGTNKPGRPAVF